VSLIKRQDSGSETRNQEPRIELPCHFRYAQGVSLQHELYFLVAHHPGQGGGWTEVSLGADVIAYVRFVPKKAAQGWRIAEVRVIDPSPDALRRIPLARIETAANANKLLQVRLAAANSQPPPPDVPGYFRQHHSKRRRANGEERFTLERPKGRHLDDSFYQQVARAYREAVAAGRNPRQTLARDTGAAPDTVARWVGEARRRGHLPPTTQGKVAAQATESEIKASRREDRRTAGEQRKEQQ
jgi:transposase-like protein